MEIGTEISQKIKTAIKTKLVEFGSYVDDELPDYIMVMVANKRSQIQMIEDLNLFLADNSKQFCDWLHDLLVKLQEVTEGAFEVRVPLKRKSTETKPETVATSEIEVLKISKLSRKPSPIRIVSDTEDSKNEESLETTNEELGKKSSGKRGRSERHHRQDEKHSGVIQSAVVIQRRPTLPASKQANPTLLKKAMQAAQAQVSTDNNCEYNPEVPSTTEHPEVSQQSAETKRIKREQLLEEHKKLQRLKSQQEEVTMEPVIELQVAEDDDLFNTEEPAEVKDRRIVMEKSPERETRLETGKKEKTKGVKKEKKSEKRKLDEEDQSSERQQSGSGSEDEEKPKEKERNVKTKEKRRKPKFIVTLEGVGNKFEEKYEKDHSRRKKRRKSNHKDDVQPEINRDVPVMPVYPQLIPGVHQVPGMIPAHFSHLGLPAAQQIHALPQTTMITAPVPVESTIQITEEDVEFDEIDKEKEKCRFWPECKNGDECPYDHPDIACTHFPNCRYGKDCSYGHPTCKFGTRCTTTSCPYTHEETPPAPEHAENVTICRYHPFCTRDNCTFLHPVDKPCRFGKKCTRPGCIFKHSVAPSREQLKWVAPVPPKIHLSERKFAVNESSTSALPVQ